MKILITGPTGFIGKHLIKQLLSDNISVIAVEKFGADIRFLEQNNIKYTFYNEYQDLFNFINIEKPDGIIHLASLFLASHTSEQLNDLVNTNVLFPLHLIEAATNADVKWFINTGTFWQHYENKEYSPVNLYAATKESFEDLAKYYYETKDINFVTLKLSDTFGPGDIRLKIFNLWIKAALSGEPLDMSPGEQFIDISYIDNVISGFSALANLLNNDKEKKFKGKSFALKAEKRMSLKDLSALFIKITGCDLKINWGKKEYRFREVMMPWETGETIPGWKPTVSLEEGIKLFYNNYKETQQ